MSVNITDLHVVYIRFTKYNILFNNVLNILLLLTVSLIHQGVRNCNDICLNDTCTSALCAVKFCNTRVFCVGFPEVFLGLTDHFIISSEEASAIITQSLFNYYFHANRDLLLCLLC